MTASAHLAWPFFGDAHRTLAAELETWVPRNVADGDEPADVDGAARELVRLLGQGGWLRYCVPASDGGASETLDVRSLCLIREALARRSELADFAFALQGLGAGPIALFGSPALRKRYLPAIARGERVAAFAISERQAGSDVGATETRAEPRGDAWVLNGEKCWISNAGIADQYVVFARSGESGTRGLSAFVVDADAKGLAVTERVRLISPHPIGTVTLSDCVVTADRLIGAPGDGFRIAMATLDRFRSTVGAAALGFARRALDETLERVRARVAFGKAIGEHQIVRERIAEMSLDVDASALLVYRAAWLADSQTGRITREAAMAKLYATEAAQRVVDAAVQLHGATGVVAGAPVERLYRAVRALRIYEGTSEIQKLVIAERTLRDAEGGA